MAFLYTSNVQAQTDPGSVPGVTEPPPAAPEAYYPPADEGEVLGEEDDNNYVLYKEVRYEYDEIPDIQKGDTFEIHGGTYPHAVVEVTINSKTYTTTSDENGHWSVTVTTDDLDTGEHSFQVSVIREGEEEPEVDEPVPFTVVDSEEEDVSPLEEDTSEEIEEEEGKSRITLIVCGIALALILLAGGAYVIFGGQDEE
ncbi:MAG: Ig-like domain-containing protein [Patescibacteria group bacterium]|nr:Ig-like domain-containing protein [Patescibacteria group bacterium]